MPARFVWLPDVGEARCSQYECGLRICFSDLSLFEVFPSRSIGTSMPSWRANAAYKRQRHNPAVTEIVKILNRGHSLTIDHGWREVAQTALDFVERFASPGRRSGRSAGTAPACRQH